MKDSILGIIRHVLTTGGGAIAAQGHLASDEVNLAVGAIVTIVGVVWSVIEKRKAK
jgi:hypothetical protein